MVSHRVVIASFGLLAIGVAFGCFNDPGGTGGDGGTGTGSPGTGSDGSTGDGGTSGDDGGTSGGTGGGTATGDDGTTSETGDATGGTGSTTDTGGTTTDTGGTTTETGGTTTETDGTTTDTGGTTTDTTSTTTTSTSTGGAGGCQPINPGGTPGCGDGQVVAGDICFEPSINNISVGSDPRGIAVADIDVNDRLDLVVVNRGGDEAHILLGNGNGGFTSNGTVSSGGTGANSVILGPVNDDVNPDLVVASRDAKAVRVYIGDGSGSFIYGSQNSVVTAANESWAAPEDIALGDLDGDGAGDILAVVWDTVNVLYGNGDGTFDAVISISQVAAVEGSDAVNMLDLDGSGGLDAVVGFYDTNNVGVFLNDGIGNLVYDSWTTAGGGSDGMVDLAVGDFDANDVPDVAAPVDANGELHVLLGDGLGGLNSDVSPLSVNNTKYADAGDMDADCVDDLVTHRHNGNVYEIALYGSKGDGNFWAPVTVSLPEEPSDIRTGDFNSDGMGDVVVALPNAGEIGVWLSDP